MNSNEYMKDYMSNRRANRRKKLLSLLGNACEKCGSKEDLEFNHKDLRLKSFSLSGYNLDTSWDKIMKELEKCELLCRSHHLEATRVQYKNGEIRPWNDKRYVPYICGTVRSYQEIKCKCELCRKAKSLYRNKFISYDEVIPEGQP